MLFIYRMFRLVSAGILYLFGISIVLAIKPSFMFSEDGTWKEFGIGRSQKTHTWMPFWLFAVLWALVSYISVAMFCLMKGIVEPGEKISTSTKVSSTAENNMDVVDEVLEVTPEDIEIPAAKPKKSKFKSKMADGYYILNRRATELSGGIPKYIYLGKGLPE